MSTHSLSDYRHRHELSRAWLRKGWRWFAVGASLNVVTLGAIPIQFSVADPFWSAAILGIGIGALALMLGCFWRQRVCNRKAMKVWGPS